MTFYTRANRVYGFTTPYTVALSYLSGANGSKTGMIATYQNGSDDMYFYEYDANGNITSITQGWSQATYTYDDMNQLVRVNDGFANLTSTYTYDLSGNILERNEYDYTTGALGTPTDTVAYTYNTTWRDQLLSARILSRTFALPNNQNASKKWLAKLQVSSRSFNAVITLASFISSGVKEVKQQQRHDQ